MEEVAQAKEERNRREALFERDAVLVFHEAI
jgi:hypothetical protein